MTTATLTRYVQVTNQSDISGQGSGHGPQHLRILRLANGTLVGQYLTASPNPRPTGDNDDYHKHVHIVRSTDDGATWTEIATFESGFTSGELFTLANGTIYLLCTPNGQPSLWDSVSNTVRAIPGAFQTTWPSGMPNVSPYDSLTVAPDGSYAIVARSRVNAGAMPNKPWTVEFCTIHVDGTFGPVWTATVPEGRYTYGHSYLSADGLLRYFGYLDVLPAELGYASAGNWVGYVFTNPSMLVFDPTAQTFVGSHVIYTATPNADGSAPMAQLVEAFPLANGTGYLVAYTGRDGGHGSTYFNEIARVANDGTVIWRDNGPFAYGGFYRFVSLSGGKVAVVNAVATDASNPPVLNYAVIDPVTGPGPAQTLALTGVPIDWSPGPENEYTLSRRSGGVTPDDLCLLWFESTSGGGSSCGLLFLSISFSGTPAPTPDPTPTPTPPPAPAPDPQIAALQEQVASLSAQLATSQSRVSSLATQLATAQDQETSLQADDTTLTAQVAALLGELAAARGINTDLARQVADLAAQIRPIEDLTGTNSALVSDNARLNSCIAAALRELGAR